MGKYASGNSNTYRYCHSCVNGYGYTNAYPHHLADNGDGGSSLRRLWWNR